MPSPLQLAQSDIPAHFNERNRTREAARRAISATSRILRIVRFRRRRHDSVTGRRPRIRLCAARQARSQRVSRRHGTRCELRDRELSAHQRARARSVRGSDSRREGSVVYSISHNDARKELLADGHGGFAGEGWMHRVRLFVSVNLLPILPRNVPSRCWPEWF